MVAHAGLYQHERIELIRCALIQMSPQNVPHSFSIQALTSLLVPPLVGRAAVRIQLPFVAGDDSEPEPDVALVDPKPRLDSHPDRAFLIIEVANDSSDSIARRRPAALRSERAGIPGQMTGSSTSSTASSSAASNFFQPVGSAYATLTLFVPARSSLRRR